MKTEPSTLPGIRTLYYRDRIFSRSLGTIGFGIFATVMISWAAQPVPSAVNIERSPIDIWLATSGPTAALVAAVLALAIAVRRYHQVRKVLSQGTIIQGTVVELDIYEREASHSNTTPAFQRPKIRTYYATLHYHWKGVTHQVSHSLPHSASTYRIYKGKETDLILLDSAPEKPLIRALYLEQPGPRRSSWWRHL